MILHSCDDCQSKSKEVEHCLCDKCLDSIKNDAYEEGYKDARENPDWAVPKHS